MLGPDDLAALLAGRASPPALRGGRAAAYASAGLASAFLVTELLQVMDGPGARPVMRDCRDLGSSHDFVPRESILHLSYLS